MADAVRRLGDRVGSLAAPTPVEIMEIGETEAGLARRYASGPQGLQACLADFEQTRARYDQQVFEALRAVSDTLAVIAVDATTADAFEYLPLPAAGR